MPQGWWHYAVALERSVTVQRNFYNAATNARGLIDMVVKSAQQLKGAGAAQGSQQRQGGAAQQGQAPAAQRTA